MKLMALITLALATTAVLTACTNSNGVPRSSTISQAPRTQLSASTPIPTPTAKGAPLKSAVRIKGETAGSDGVYFAVDNGSRLYARGSVTTSKTGTPIAYKVVSGDQWNGIAGRFGLDSEELYTDNSVRRGCADNGDITSIFVGDTLNLDPHTILAVGTENGKVCHIGDRANPFPPQETLAAALWSP